MRLVREWQRTVKLVTIGEDKVSWRNRKAGRSLSEVTCAITDNGERRLLA